MKTRKIVMTMLALAAAFLLNNNYAQEQKDTVVLPARFGRLPILFETIGGFQGAQLTIKGEYTSAAKSESA